MRGHLGDRLELLRMMPLDRPFSIRGLGGHICGGSLKKLSGEHLIDDVGWSTGKDRVHIWQVSAEGRRMLTTYGSRRMRP